MLGSHVKHRMVPGPGIMGSVVVGGEVKVPCVPLVSIVDLVLTVASSSNLSLAKHRPSVMEDIAEEAKLLFCR